jgi:Fe-S cluster assembly scaffold protein SufB
MKTREEVDKLKHDWLRDPIWDIYDTEGFEEYKDELTDYQKKINDNYKLKLQEEHNIEKSEAEKLGLHGLYRIVKDLYSQNVRLHEAVEYLTEGQTNSAYRTLRNDPEYVSDIKPEININKYLDSQTNNQQQTELIKEELKYNNRYVIYLKDENGERILKCEECNKEYDNKLFEESKKTLKIKYLGSYDETEIMSQINHWEVYCKNNMFVDYKVEIPDVLKKENKQNQFNRQIEIAAKTAYVQGVCECVAIISDDHTLGKKLLSEMNVTKDMAKKYANPKTYKTLEKGIFVQKQDQKIEQTQGVKR